MRKKKRTGVRIQRKPKTKTATIEFVSNRTTRARAITGERFVVQTDRYQDVLPGDVVELIEFKGGRHQRTTAAIHSVERLPEHTIVGWIRERTGTASALDLIPLGFGRLGIIDVNAGATDLKHGDYVMATVAKRHNQSWTLLRIDRVLENSRDIAVSIALCRFGIREQWPEAVDVEIARIEDTSLTDCVSVREDLRNLPFVTIDPSSAKDHDDAIYCEFDGDAGRLLVAIADVCFFVEAGSAVDQEANSRGSSIYLPEKLVPMLPSRLSSDLCSLVPGEDRLALVCDMKIDAKGKVVSYKFLEAVIRSHARLSYSEITAEGVTRDHSDEVTSSIARLLKLHERQLRARQDRGALELDIPAMRMKFDRDGDVESIEKSERMASHSLIEEAMLAANVCAAEFLHQHYPKAAMYRVHDAPIENDLIELNGILEPHGMDFPVDGIPEVGNYEILITQASAQSDFLCALQIHILRSLSTAVYSERKDPHFALNYPLYTHFTSPIRRYPDLIVHRMIKQALNNSSDSYNSQELNAIALQSSYFERRAESCEREADKWLKVNFMKDYVEHVFDSVIVDVKSFGLFVQLHSPYVDGMVSIYDLGSEYFQYSDYSRKLTGSVTGTCYGVGMPLRVRVSDVNVELGHINLKLVDRKSSRRMNKISKRG